MTQIEQVTLLEIGGIIAFVVALIKGVEYISQPYTRTKNRLSDLEKKTSRSEEELKELKEFMRVNFVAIKELLKHEIEGGNNKQGMMMASKEIDTFLAKKI